MDQNQTKKITKKPIFWLFLLLFIFFIKGVFFSALLPIFQGPDEQLHYATIQYRAEPDEKTWPITKLSKRTPRGDDISTYGFSEETIRSAQATQFDTIKFQSENTQDFSDTSTGFAEKEITGNTWKHYIDTYPTNASGTTSIYYMLGAKIEQTLSQQSIFVRFFSDRILSVLFGAFVILFTYLTAKIVGFSKRNSLLVAILVAFQPMLSATAAQVNIDIALILAFSFFIYVSVSLLKDGLSWKRSFLLGVAIILALLSKGPGIVLAVVALPLLIYIIYVHLHPNRHAFLWTIFISGSVLTAAFFLFVPQEYLASITNLGAISKFDSPIASLSAYTDKTFGTGALLRTEASYWGNFGWLDTPISDIIIRAIIAIEMLAWIGVILYFLHGYGWPRLKTRLQCWFGVEKSYLPARSCAIFLVGIIVALQLAIRFYDWRIFDTTGKILIGQPGRYFLPNVVPHILLMVTGLGFFTRNKQQFGILLKSLLILAVLLAFYAMIDVIIPRYYL